ncbi:MAG: hypothetical protein KGZ92_08155 [Firmicutes bacterium]|nr:hypothetical protein [Dethiobacter sp.]MBS3889240.1 hypothetical protein [Bacillota bacterium]MBS4054593.1 hypothetical protein [Thermaerobacter sp.]
MEWSATIVLLAIVVEQVTTVLKGAVPAIKGNLAQATSMLVGIVLCFSTRVGLLQQLSVPTVYPFVDYLVSGLLISRGSNFLHDVIHKLGTLPIKKI